MKDVAILTGAGQIGMILAKAKEFGDISALINEAGVSILRKV